MAEWEKLNQNLFLLERDHEFITFMKDFSQLQIVSIQSSRDQQELIYRLPVSLHITTYNTNLNQ